MITQNTTYAPSEILLVDDSPANLDVLSTLLNRQGYTVRTAINGALALRTIAVAPPDLILLDVIMPEMDGFEVCRRLKANPASAGIPVIFLTALDNPPSQTNSFRLIGAVDYITKPFRLDDVLIRVEAHLALAYARRQGQQAGPYGSIA